MKRLELKKVTLRNLDEAALDRVAGGVDIAADLRRKNDFEAIATSGHDPGPTCTGFTAGAACTSSTTFAH